MGKKPVFIPVAQIDRMVASGVAPQQVQSMLDQQNIIQSAKSDVGEIIKTAGNVVVDVGKLGVQGLMVIPNALNKGDSLLGEEWDPVTGALKSVDSVIDKADQAGHWVGQQFVKYLTGGQVDLGKASLFEKGGLEETGVQDYAVNYAVNNSDAITYALGSAVDSLTGSNVSGNTGIGGNLPNVDLGKLSNVDINLGKVDVPNIDFSGAGGALPSGPVLGGVDSVLASLNLSNADVVPLANIQGPPRNPYFNETVKKINS